MSSIDKCSDSGGDLKIHLYSFERDVEFDLLFVTQKLPKNREFLAWNLFCNIDMELVTGLEPLKSLHKPPEIGI